MVLQGRICALVRLALYCCCGFGDAVGICPRPPERCRAAGDVYTVVAAIDVTSTIVFDPVIAGAVAYVLRHAVAVVRLARQWPIKKRDTRRMDEKQNVLEVRGLTCRGTAGFIFSAMARTKKSMKRQNKTSNSQWLTTFRPCVMSCNDHEHHPAVALLELDSHITTLPTRSVLRTTQGLRRVCDAFHHVSKGRPR